MFKELLEQRHEVFTEPELFVALSPEKQTEFNEKFSQILQDDLPIVLPQDDDVDGYVCATLFREAIQLLRPDKQVFVYIPEQKTHGVNEEFLRYVTANYPKSHIIITDSSSECGVTLAKLSVNHKLFLIDHHLTNIMRDLEGICYYVANCRYEADSRFHKLSAGFYCYLHLSHYLNSKSRLTAQLSEEWFSLGVLSLVADVCDMTDPYNRSALRHYMDSMYNHKLLQCFVTKFTRNGLYFLAFQVAPKLNMLFRLRYIHYLRSLHETQDLQSIIDMVNLIYSNFRAAIDQSLSFLDVYDYGRFLYGDTSEIPEIFTMFRHNMFNFTGWYANKLSQLYAKPCIIVSQTGENSLKGSVRDSLREDIYSICDSLPYIEGGGHPSAYGFTIDSAHIQQLKFDFNAAYPEVSQRPVSMGEINSLVELNYLDSEGDIKDMANYNDYTLNDKLGIKYTLKFSDVIDYGPKCCKIKNDKFKIICFETTLCPGDTVKLIPDHVRNGLQLIAEIIEKGSE